MFKKRCFSFLFCFPAGTCPCPGHWPVHRTCFEHMLIVFLCFRYYLYNLVVHRWRTFLSLQREKKRKLQNAQSFGMISVYLTLHNLWILDTTKSCCVVNHFSFFLNQLTDNRCVLFGKSGRFSQRWGEWRTGCLNQLLSKTDSQLCGKFTLFTK